MTQHFGDVLTSYIEDRQRSSGQLSALSGIPKHTIVSWREGRVKRPRSIVDILKIAQALNLSVDECECLLASASKPTLSEMSANRDVDDPILQDLLDTWLGTESSQEAEPSVVPMTAPRSTVTFVNRHILLADLKDALLEKSVCALWGMGGIGKTEIAKIVVAEMAGAYPDGVLWADLYGVGTERMTDNQRLGAILGNWLELCGWRLGNDGGDYESIESRSRVLRTILSQRKMLMVINDANSADEIEWFLPPPASESALLLTTRNSRIARAHAKVFEVSRLTLDESVELLQGFVDKDRLYSHEESLKKLANLLDGHPLALSIVGSDLEETRSLTMAEYCDLLEDEQMRLAHLSDWEDGSKDVRATFELSYRRMRRESQEMLMALSLFRDNDFTAEAVAAAVDQPILQVKRLLGRLCSLALVEEIFPQESSRSHVSRYRLHRLICAFASEKRAESEHDWHAVSLRLSDYYVHYVAQHQAQPFTGLAAEWGNILAAIEWLSDQQEMEMLIKLVGGLTAISMGLAGYLDGAGHWPIAIQYLERLIEVLGADEQSIRHSDMKIRLAYFYQRTGQNEQALATLEDAETQLKERFDQAEGQMLLAHLHQLRSRIFEQTDRQAAHESITQALACIQQEDIAADDGEEGYLLIRYGSIMGQLGQLDEALAYSLQGLALRSAEPTAALASGLTNVGIIHDIQGRSEEAIHSWREAMVAAEAIGDLMRQGTLWNNLGIAESQRGQLHDAIKADLRALECYQPFDFVEGQTRIYHNIGADYCMLRNFELATAYLNKAEALAMEYSLSAYLVPILINQLRLALDMQQDMDTLQQLWTRLSDLQAIEPEVYHQREIDRLGIELALRRKDLASAKASMDQLLEESEANPYEQGLTYRLYAKVLDQLGEHSQAREAYTKSADVFTTFNQFEYARTLLSLGLHDYEYAKRKQGKMNDAGRAALNEARNYFVESDYRTYLELFPDEES